jgi:sec-independent protein translocase protein TatB
VFDIGFSELVVCAIVALVVIGPERMPEAVRTVGLWIGRFKRSLRETRSEIERQMGVDDIRRQLHNEEIMRNLEQARRDMDSVFVETQQAITSSAEIVRREYTSEPDLPYHAHMDEANAEQSETKATEAAPAIAIESAQSKVPQIQAAAQATSANATPATNSIAPEKSSAPASHKESL